MTDKLRESAQQALDVLEQLQGGCTDSDDGTIEVITVWCPEVVEALRSALAQQDAQAVSQHLADDERVAALCDLSYVAGMKAGWNFCVSDDSDRFERRQNSVGEAIRILKSHRAPTPPAQQDAQAVPHEPVARLMKYVGKGTYPKKGYTVARTYEECPKDAYPNDWEEGPELHTHPSPMPPAQRVMLTDDEIERLWYPSAAIAEPGTRRVAFGRAVIEAYERKNGIK